MTHATHNSTTPTPATIGGPATTSTPATIGAPATISAEQDSATRGVQASSFGAVAQTYAAVRPGYPVTAVRWGLPPAAREALDLGAGTGQIARVLVAEGLTVHAVEPDERMLAELRRTVPAAHAHLGRAEQIALPSASVDAVLVGHAFHWFGQQALDEMARVLRPGGTVALLWNLRDDSTDWVGRFSEIIALGAQDSTSFESPTPFTDARFSVAVRRTFPHRQHISREGLLALVGTRGYVLALPQAQRTALLDQVTHLMDTHPQLAGHDNFDLPYVTEVWRAQRQTDPSDRSDRSDPSDPGDRTDPSGDGDA